MENYDLIVIGAGPAGYDIADLAARNGLKTMIVEKELPGGTCLNRGCIPTKTLLASAHFYGKIKSNSRTLGLTIDNIGFDYAKIAARKERVIKRSVMALEQGLKDSPLTYIKGEAEVLPEKIVRVNSEEYKAEKIVIATGSDPLLLPGFKFDGERVIGSTEALNFQDLPASLLIVGAGVIGLELADFFSTFGVKIYLVDILDKLIPGVDDAALKLVRGRLERQGCEFILGDSVQQYDREKVLLKSGRELNVEKILLAAGRKYNSELVKDPAITKGRRGEIAINENFETTVAGVYAVGDVNGLSLYAHAASAQGRIVLNNILAGKKESFDAKLVPSVIFTKPQIAALGKTDGAGQKIKELSFNMNAMAQAEQATEGFVKIFINEQNDVLEGVVIAGENAESLIGTAVVMINKKVTVDDFVKMIFPHPTTTEIFRDILL